MADAVLSLKGDQRVLASLERAAKSKLDPSDIFEQRVSFAYSVMSGKGSVTKDQVRKIVKSHDSGDQTKR